MAFKSDFNELAEKLNYLRNSIDQFDANPGKFNLTSKQVALRKQDFSSLASFLKELED